MALQASGAISFQDIQDEFGGSHPISFSEYYGGGDKVPAGANPGIATSGAININSFYEAVAATVLTISSNVSNYNIKTAALAAGGDQSTPVILTIDSGVTVSSSSATTPAMKTDTGWSSGNTINITNNGSIVGASASNASNTYKDGGDGGDQGNSAYNGEAAYQPDSSTAAIASTNGGDAFEHSQTGDNNLSVVFDTAGTRTGGSSAYVTYIGGGGGGGAGHSGGGGGGGAGTPVGAGGTGNGGGDDGTTTTGGAGKSGSTTLHGWNGGTPMQSYTGNGGNGGNSNTSGQSGTGSYNYYSGGTTSTYAGAGGAGASNYNKYGTAGSALAGNTGQIS